MSTDPAYLALMLDAPLMSFGHASRFQRRTTALHPTRSAIMGMICAAVGADRGSPDEAEWLERLDPGRVGLVVFAIPRKRADGSLAIRRLEDYHTIQGTRSADGKIKKDAVLSHRQYLLDALFGVIMKGSRETLEPVAAALRNPRWGIWFGRKNCIPAAPVVRALVDAEADAMTALGLDGQRLDQFNSVAEAASFGEGTDTFMDVPTDFRARTFRPRRIAVQTAQA